MTNSPGHRQDDGCPCGGASLKTCCGPYLSGLKLPDPVSLMRSRYTAYVVGDKDYLVRTWDPTTRPRFLELDDTIRWLRLIIHDHAVWPNKGRAIVYFTAVYMKEGRKQWLREKSLFTLQHDRWVYVCPLDE